MSNTSVIPERFWDILEDDENIIEIFRSNPFIHKKSIRHYLLTDRRFMYDKQILKTSGIKVINLSDICSISYGQVETNEEFWGMSVEYDIGQIIISCTNLDEEINIYLSSISDPLADALQKQVEVTSSSNHILSVGNFDNPQQQAGV